MPVQHPERCAVVGVVAKGSADDRLSAAQQDLANETDQLDSLKHVWCGGEVLTPELFDRFRAQLSTTLYHGYGPAEATIGVSHVIYREDAERIATSIGRPNPNTRLYVLDGDLQPVPIGTGGELYAAGFLFGFAGKRLTSAPRPAAVGTAGTAAAKTTAVAEGETTSAAASSKSSKPVAPRHSTLHSTDTLNPSPP